MFKIYLNLFFLFWKILTNIHEYKDFLMQTSKPGKRFNQLKKPLEVRYRANIKNKTPIFQEDLALYLLVESFEQTEKQKEELLTPLCLLALIYQSYKT